MGCCTDDEGVDSIEAIRTGAVHGPTTDGLADVAEDLMLEFQQALPLSVITSVVMRARRDLDGQVIDGAFPEMLLRLSRVRLTQLQLELTA
jgi:hypothetical protein